MQKPDLGEVSKGNFQHPRLAANHRLHIDGEDWTDRTISTHVTYTTDVGGSGMEFSVYGDLEGYDDAPITLWLGYGPWLSPYFQGRVQSPSQEGISGVTNARAFGPFQTMATQQLGSDETFVGKTLAWVVMELARRAEHAPGEIMVVNGDRYYIQPGEQFPFDTMMGDVLTTLCDKGLYKAFDIPGGKRLVVPRPRPGSNANYKTSYTPNDYRSFKIEPGYDMTYYKVIVYRNGDDGKPEVYAERMLSGYEGRRKPPKNRWYVVSDFAGDGAGATQEAYDLGVSLVGGEKKFNMECFFNPKLGLYDGFRAVQRIRGTTRTYSCSIDGTIDVTHAPGEPAFMTLTGKAYELRDQRKIVQRPRRDWVVSQGIMRRREIEEYSDMDLLDGLILSEGQIMTEDL